MCLLISKESMYFFCPYFYHRHHAQLFSCVQLFAALWTTARQGKKKKSSPSGSSVHGILQTRILEWVAIPFSRGSSQPRNRTWDSCIQADSSPSEPPGKPLSCAWIQFSSVAQSCLIFPTPWIAARQASLSITNSQSSLKLTSIQSVMPSSHLILCRPLLLLPPIPPSIRVFSNESTLRMRCMCMYMYMVYIYIIYAAKSLQSCPTLCDPIDSSPPGSAVPGILQARTLEWVAISFPNAWKWKWSRSVVSDSPRPMDCSPPGSSVHGILLARVLEWVAICI